MIGTSGWSYAHWKTAFYPDKISDSNMLDYYASRLQSVEINCTFYKLPNKDTLRNWYQSVSDNFVFAAKASRYITHMRKLNDPSGILPAFFERISILGDKLGPVLFQMPPHWRVNASTIASVVRHSDMRGRYLLRKKGESTKRQAINTCRKIGRSIPFITF